MYPCACLLASFLIATPIPGKIAETAVQVYLPYVNATFGSSLTLIADNGKEFKNELIQEVEEELGIKYQF